MQERRLKRLGLLDDDGKSTYDGAQRHTHKQCCSSPVPRQEFLHAHFVFCNAGKWSRHFALCADFFKDGIA